MPYLAGLFWLFRRGVPSVNHEGPFEPNDMLRMLRKQITCFCILCLHLERQNTQQDMTSYLRIGSGACRHRLRDERLAVALVLHLLPLELNRLHICERLLCAPV